MFIFLGILLFSFLIFIHELGHFVAAKLSGVQVNEFAMFMGPAIVKWQRGETQYSIRCIPFGGYCAMEGEDADTENPRSFQKAAWWKRLIILVAGVAMNFVGGVILMAIFVSPKEKIPEPVIDYTQPGCTIVREDGLQVGDEILKVDGERIFVASDVSLMLQINPSDTHDLVIRRGDEKIVLNDYEMLPREDGSYGIVFSSSDATLGKKIGYTWNWSMDQIRCVRLSLQMLIRGDAGIQDVSGPVGIVQGISSSAEQADNAGDAVMMLLFYGAFLSLNLAVMNLLPIPAVDGGRVFGLLVTTAIEAITGKKVNSKYEGYIHGAGLILLLALMAVVMFKDILFIFKG